tara:strand:+ start:189 stop:980 length:792 start_codon:yes stop_codon:yes gene_type:complete
MDQQFLFLENNINEKKYKKNIENFYYDSIKQIKKNRKSKIQYDKEKISLVTTVNNTDISTKEIPREQKIYIENAINKLKQNIKNINNELLNIKYSVLFEYLDVHSEDNYIQLLNNSVEPLEQKKEDLFKLYDKILSVRININNKLNEKYKELVTQKNSKMEEMKEYKLEHSTNKVSRELFKEYLDIEKQLYLFNEMKNKKYFNFMDIKINDETNVNINNIDDFTSKLNEGIILKKIKNESNNSSEGNSNENNSNEGNSSENNE